MIAIDLSLEEILNEVRRNEHVQGKINIADTHEKIGATAKLPEHYTQGKKIATEIWLGDDCTAIPDGKGGHTLFAAEGIISSFLQKDPWFAGYSAVMVNISDVYSMGGLPTAVTDVVWGKDMESLDKVWEGMLAAATAYDVPIVGGHTCLGVDSSALSVSILGSADQLLTSFSTKPNQQLLMAVDMSGAYYKSYPFWNASTDSDATMLREKGSILHEIAQKGLANSCKDISMGGLLGTIAMLMNTSKVGFEIDFDKVIAPPDGDWVRWLTAFPSFGFILSCDEESMDEIIDIFEDHDVHCRQIGEAKREQELIVLKKEARIKFI